MLPAAVERILASVPDDARVLDVGGWAAPFNRADAVLDAMPFESRGPDGHHGPPWERFTARSWVQRDACARPAWPWADDSFDFAVCVATLEQLRDPIWVCEELSRVARAGYVELATIEAELILDAEGPYLGRDEHRWLCELSGGELVFTQKPHAIHHDSSLRVQPRWLERMAPEDHVQGLFWEGNLPARERLLVGAERAAALDDLRRRLRERFEPSTAEVRVRQARDVARQGAKLAGGVGRQAAGRLFDEVTRRREK